MPATEIVITAAVEGDMDEALLRRIMTYAGFNLGTVYGRKGKPFLLQSIQGYNNAARFSPWVVLIDLNGDFDCAPESLREWLPNPALHMCLRILVRMGEAWALADRERMARWLRVAEAKLPDNPDNLKNPKRDLINLARQSRRPQLRKDLVPREGSGRAVGPLYTSRMIEFIQDENEGWRPGAAIHRSNSLDRCIRSLQRFAKNIE